MGLTHGSLDCLRIGKIEDQRNASYMGGRNVAHSLWGQYFRLLDSTEDITGTGRPEDEALISSVAPYPVAQPQRYVDEAEAGSPSRAWIFTASGYLFLCKYIALQVVRHTSHSAEQEH